MCRASNRAVMDALCWESIQNTSKKKESIHSLLACLCQHFDVNACVCHNVALNQNEDVQTQPPPTAAQAMPSRPNASASHTCRTHMATHLVCSFCTTRALHSDSRCACPACCAMPRAMSCRGRGRARQPNTGPKTRLKPELDSSKISSTFFFPLKKPTFYPIM